MSNHQGAASAATDAVLWTSAGAGDPGAFSDLYRRHSDAVYNHAFRRTASWERAEDVTSVVFLEAWRRRSDVLLTQDSLLPWLLGVANNVLRREFRTQIRYRNALARLPDSFRVEDHAEDVASRLDDETRMQQVLQAMTHLTRVEQETVALCVWAGLTYEQAAVAMAVPIGTVRSRLARARSRLRGLTDPIRELNPQPRSQM